MLGGETGTGKELTARAVHDLSGRAGPFVAVNCGALPEALVESELFGARKGAFSGATEDRPGLVRAAHRGTLFLDEIAELPLGSQAELLRVLQEGEVMPLGATQPVAVDLRVVAATHRLAARAGRARAASAPTSTPGWPAPPSRCRRCASGARTSASWSRPLLQRAAAARHADAVRFEREAARALFLHRWPLNVRELEQALRAALALAGRRPHRAGPPAGGGARAAGRAGGDPALRDQLVRLLAEHGGNISAVARGDGQGAGPGPPLVPPLRHRSGRLPADRARRAEVRSVGGKPGGAARFDPPGFVERHGVVLASARGPVPNVAEAVAGEPIRGSWWGHPASPRSSRPSGVTARLTSSA